MRSIEHLQVLDSISDTKRKCQKQWGQKDTDCENVILYVSRFEGILHQSGSNDQFEEICLSAHNFHSHKRCHKNNNKT